MNVLLIEDDTQLNSTITKYLTKSNFEVTSTNDGDKAISYIDMIKYDLFIIDINIPNVNGLDVVKYIRQKDLITPIIIITAALELNNFTTAFENGCNEYIKKPFYLEELQIRINNLMDKNKNNTTIIQISNNITYDTEYEELIINNEVIKLRKKERRLLTLLLQNINRSVSVETIENYVWENEIKEVYPLRQLIAELRKKFNTEENFIFADRGIGYKFEINN